MPLATVFQLYHGGDTMTEMSSRKPEPTLLPTLVIFTLPHHIGMVWEELAFDDAASYIHCIKMDCNTAKCYGNDQDLYPCPQGPQPSALTNWAISPPPRVSHGEETILTLPWPRYQDTVGRVVPPSSLTYLLEVLFVYIFFSLVNILYLHRQ